MFSFASHMKLMHGSAIHSRPKRRPAWLTPRPPLRDQKNQAGANDSDRNSGQNRARGRNRNGGDSDNDERNLRPRPG